MFKLSTPPALKKSEEIKKEEGYSEDILAIHNEFNTAADTLLERAKETLDSLDLTGEDKANRLSKFGFKANSDVRRIEEEQRKAERAKADAETVLHYKKHYPDNKFITREQISIICKKYGLVCGGVEKYTGFVPEKNLQEIEDFKGVRQEDMGDEPSNRVIGTLWRANTAMSSLDHYYAVAAHAVDKEEKKESAPLQIAAPLKDMKLDSDEYVDSDGMIKKHIPDPVVLQPVNKGYLVLTAWGCYL